MICSNEQPREARQMNKAELSARIATETSLSTADVEDAVTAVFSTIDDALASGGSDRIAGLRTFSMRSQKARQSQNLRARARASPSTPRTRLHPRPARPFATPPTSGRGRNPFRCARPMRHRASVRSESTDATNPIHRVLRRRVERWGFCRIGRMRVHPPCSRHPPKKVQLPTKPRLARILDSIGLHTLCSVEAS